MDSKKSRPVPASRGICLVVEDSPVDLEIFARVMSRSGVHVSLCFVDSLGGARAALDRERVRLILLDNTLPDGHGADFALELARHETHRYLPIVLVTDWPSPFMFDKARRAGVRGVYAKADLRPERVAEFFAT